MNIKCNGSHLTPTQSRQLLGALSANNTIDSIRAALDELEFPTPVNMNPLQPLSTTPIRPTMPLRTKTNSSTRAIRSPSVEVFSIDRNDSDQDTEFPDDISSSSRVNTPRSRMPRTSLSKITPVSYRLGRHPPRPGSMSSSSCYSHGSDNEAEDPPPTPRQSASQNKSPTKVTLPKSPLKARARSNTVPIPVLERSSSPLTAFVNRHSQSGPNDQYDILLPSSGANLPDSALKNAFGLSDDDGRTSCEEGEADDEDDPVVSTQFERMVKTSRASPAAGAANSVSSRDLDRSSVDTATNSPFKRNGVDRSVGGSPYSSPSRTNRPPSDPPSIPLPPSPSRSKTDILVISPNRPHRPPRPTRPPPIVPIRFLTSSPFSDSSDSDITFSPSSDENAALYSPPDRSALSDRLTLPPTHAYHLALSDSSPTPNEASKPLTPSVKFARKVGVVHAMRPTTIVEDDYAEKEPTLHSICTPSDDIAHHSRTRETRGDDHQVILSDISTREASCDLHSQSSSLSNASHDMASKAPLPTYDDFETKINSMETPNPTSPFSPSPAWSDTAMFSPVISEAAFPSLPTLHGGVDSPSSPAFSVTSPILSIHSPVFSSDSDWGGRASSAGDMSDATLASLYHARKLVGPGESENHSWRRKGKDGGKVAIFRVTRSGLMQRAMDGHCGPEDSSESAWDDSDSCVEHEFLPVGRAAGTIKFPSITRPAPGNLEPGPNNQAGSLSHSRLQSPSQSDAEPRRQPSQILMQTASAQDASLRPSRSRRNLNVKNLSLPLAFSRPMRSRGNSTSSPSSTATTPNTSDRPYFPLLNDDDGDDVPLTSFLSPKTLPDHEELLVSGITQNTVADVGEKTKGGSRFASLFKKKQGNLGGSAPPTPISTAAMAVRQEVGSVAAGDFVTVKKPGVGVEAGSGSNECSKGLLGFKLRKKSVSAANVATVIPSENGYDWSRESRLYGDERDPFTSPLLTPVSASFPQCQDSTQLQYGCSSPAPPLPSPRSKKRVVKDKTMISSPTSPRINVASKVDSYFSIPIPTPTTASSSASSPSIPWPRPNSPIPTRPYLYSHSNASSATLADSSPSFMDDPHSRPRGPPSPTKTATTGPDSNSGDLQYVKNSRPAGTFSAPPPLPSSPLASSFITSPAVKPLKPILKPTLSHSLRSTRSLNTNPACKSANTLEPEPGVEPIRARHPQTPIPNAGDVAAAKWSALLAAAAISDASDEHGVGAGRVEQDHQNGHLRHGGIDLMRGRLPGPESELRAVTSSTIGTAADELDYMDQSGDGTLLDGPGGAVNVDAEYFSTGETGVGVAEGLARRERRRGMMLI
ncbi:hypothetical protein DL93DRAFT_2160700 [Clavulina sp. PMI_390]|nr:hypothetical protein DL93DRAFT_2160700 [Clavulina sp. PMI_390]